MKKIVDSRSKTIWSAYEKWGWLIVTLIWAVAFLFAATLALIAFGTIIVYPFVGAEASLSVALLADAILLVGIVALSFELRNRRVRGPRRSLP